MICALINLPFSFRECFDPEISVAFHSASPIAPLSYSLNSSVTGCRVECILLILWHEEHQRCHIRQPRAPMPLAMTVPLWYVLCSSFKCCTLWYAIRCVLISRNVERNVTEFISAQASSRHGGAARSILTKNFALLIRLPAPEPRWPSRRPKSCCNAAGMVLSVTELIVHGAECECLITHLL